MIHVTDYWRTSHPGGAVGLLSLTVDSSNLASGKLDQKRLELESSLREMFKDMLEQFEEGLLETLAQIEREVQRDFEEAIGMFERDLAELVDIDPRHMSNPLRYATARFTMNSMKSYRTAERTIDMFLIHHLFEFKDRMGYFNDGYDEILVNYVQQFYARMIEEFRPVEVDE